ncbi:MAG TPA: hypothetical protein VM123_06930 [archaeon]|nr:hypothetical protein [archaeon]
MSLSGQRYFGVPPRFDPEQGTTVLEPEGEGYGYWAGGHNVIYDPGEGKFYLYYRLRKPLGKGRGGKCRIAESEDGFVFRDIWEAAKEQLDAESIEVGALIKDPPSGIWRLYISYQQKGGGPWRVDLIEAGHPRDFDPWHHRTVIQPEEYGLSQVKDPKAYIVGGLYYLFVNVKPRLEWYEDENGVRHPLGSDATGLMTSPDGRYFKEFRYVFEPGRGAPGEWGLARARINSVIYLPPVYVGFFDGGTTAYDMYEEHCGVAVSHDLEHWRRVSTDGPWIRSPYGCIRYMDALIVDNTLWYYYEYTRRDSSHELRVNKVELS